MAKPQKIKNKDGTTSWRIRVVDADGKRVSRTFASFDLAKSELRRLEVQTDEALALRDRDPSMALTVDAAFERHKTTNKRQPGETERRFARRWRRLQTHFDHHISPSIGSALLAELTPRRLREWIGELAAKKTARPGEKNAEGRTLSAATIRAIVTSLSQIVKANDVPFAVLLPASMKQQKRRARPKAFQSIDEVRAFLEACRDPWFKVAAAIACYAGARLGEVASLRYRDIGTETIAITESWGGPLKARYETGEEAARVVPLDPELETLLAAWRKLTNGGPDDLVVLVNGERPLDEAIDTDLARRTRRTCERAQVTPLTFHELRASYATIVADQGLPVTRLSALLGHSDIATTARYIRPESAHAARDPRARIGGRSVDDGHASSLALVN